MNPSNFQNNEITVKGKDGGFYKVPRTGLASALRDGYIVPSNDEIQHQIDLQKAGEGINPLIAGVEAGASAATFGLSREAVNALGVSTPEEQALRQEANPIASGIGTVAGIAAPLLLTGGAAAPAVVGGEAAGLARAGLVASDIINPVSAVSKIGAAATEAVAPALKGALAGIAETSPRIAGLVSKAGSHAVGGAAEGALFGVGQSIDEHALGDPEALGEHLMSNVGIGALLGGGLGAAIGATKGAIAKYPKFVSEADIPALEAGEFQASVMASDIPDKNFIMKALGKRKDNADEIISIGERRGYPILEGQISANKAVQHAEDVLLSGQPTFFSVARQEMATKGFNQAAKDVDNVLRVGSEDLSEANIGNQIKKSLTDKIEQEVAPINSLYDELKSKHELIPISDQAKRVISRNISELQEVKISKNSPVAKIANGIIEDFDNLKTVDDIRARRIQLNQSLSPMASPAERNIVGTISEKLKSLEDNSIIRFAKNDMKTSVAKEKMLSLIENVRKANGQYKEFITKAQELARGLGKKNISGAQGLIDFIEEINPQKIADKIFTDKNVEFSKFMKERFPQEFESARKFQIGRMREEASKKGFLDVKQFTKTLDKLEPETKSLLFSADEMAVISDANKYLRSFPESFNPSKTAYANAFMDSFSGGAKSMGFANLRDAALHQFIKKSVGLKSEQTIKTGILKQLADVANRTQKAIETGAKAAFSGKGMTATIGVAENYTDKDYDKQIKTIDEMSSDPERLMNALENNTKDVHQYIPVTSAGVHKSMINATKFLSSKIPRPVNQKILSPKYKPSKSEMMKFNGYFNTIKHPTSVLRGIKTGMVTSDQMEALKSVYPQMLSQMQMAVMEQLSEHLAHDKDIPYQTKIGLSQFLEKDLTNSMSQESIAMNQMSPQGQMQNDQDGMMKPTQKGLSSLSASTRVKTNLQSIAEGAEA